MRLLDALHHIENRQIDIVPAAHASQDGMHRAGRAMHVEARVFHALDDRFFLFLGGALLHDHNHCLSPWAAIRALCTIRISSMMRSKMRRNPAARNRTLVRGCDVGEHLVFAPGLVNRQLRFAFHPTDLFHHARALIEQFHDAPIHIVDHDAELVQFLLRFVLVHQASAKPPFSSRANASNSVSNESVPE